MANKPRVLGNDPFQRGAAPRGDRQAEKDPVPKAAGAATGGKRAAPKAAGATTGRKRAAPKAAGAAQPSPPKAGQEATREPGLLPTDLASAPREPRVQAVAPIAPLTQPSRVQVETPRPTPADVTWGGLKALRQLLGLPAAAPSFEVDVLGKDAAFEEQTRSFFDWVYESWFRVQSRGFENLPASGPVILVANRAGTLPWDSLMLATACRRAGREVRPLVEDDIFHFPSVGVLINRLGAVRACPENAEWVLDRGGMIAVFPEGATGFAKPWAERYRLQRFGRGGFVKLALRTGATIVPVSIVGSEEIHPLLARLPARPLGIPFLPVTPTFPWLGAAGLIPLPARWYIDVGTPFDLSGHGPGAAEDDPLVLRITDSVRGTIQAMLDTRLSRRRSIFRG